MLSILATKARTLGVGRLIVGNQPQLASSRDLSADVKNGGYMQALRTVASHIELGGRLGCLFQLPVTSGLNIVGNLRVVE